MSSSNNQPPSTTSKIPSISSSTTATNNTQPSTDDFPVGPTARKNLKNLLRRSKNPAQEITTFQQTQSLHSVYSRAFHTTPQHELPSQKTRSSTKKAAAAAAAAAATSKNTTNPPPNRPPESFQPDPALTFLNHLGVSRFSIHSKIALALRTSLEEEIRRLPLPSCREHLLTLLHACWIPSNTVTELRPVLVSVVKRLGDSTPESVLMRLAEREEEGEGTLKYGELLSLFDVRIRRLVWEADWDGRSAGGEGGGMTAVTTGGGPNTSLLAELTREAAMIYYADEELIEQADLAFIGAIGLRRVDTPSRRGINAAGVTSAAAAASVSVVPTVGGGEGGDAAAADDGKKKSAIAVQKLKEIIGDRPKLLGAVLTTLMMEHGTLISSESPILVNNPANETLLLGYSTSGSTVGRRSLTGALVSDVILTYGSLPKSYEHLGILAKILDQSVRAGLISDDGIAQIQGCLKHIFHQFEAAAERRERSPSTTTAVVAVETKSSSSTTESSKSATANGGNSIFKPEEKKYNPHDDKPFLRNLLKQVITAALTAMKQSDHQGLFLNPVTDAIAPGYSTIVKEPMCIKTMDEKLQSNQYQSLSAYERDVRLMFQNCIDYNIGKEGQWFRGEARRQCKIWKDNILTQAKDLLRKEMVKRKRELEKKDQKKKGANGDNSTSTSNSSPSKDKKPDKKRQRDTIAAAISAAKKNKPTKSTPAPPTTSPTSLRRPPTDAPAVIRLTKADIAPLPGRKPKKRKVTSDHPSPPAIAALMLSDPFVVRLLIDKTLRYVRMETVKEKSLPGLHYAIPSLLQLLYLSQCSPQLCVNRGRRFFVPDCGLVPPPSEETTEEEDDRPTSTIPHLTLRRYLPLLMHLLVRCQLDLRLSAPGDLSSIPAEDHPPPHLPSTPSSDGTHLCVVRALVQGSLIHSLIPSGGSLASRRTAERSLAIQLPRFFEMLEGVATQKRLVTERPFWMSLARVLLRYKTKLSVGVRDEVLEFAYRWLRRGEDEVEGERSRKRKRKKKDAKNKVVNGLRSPAHEVMIWLLNEWSNLGNQIMPRDKLLEASETLGRVGEVKKTTAEKEDEEEEDNDDNDDDDNNFASLWIDAGDEEETDDNKNKTSDDVTTKTTTIERRIRHQYEIMLRNVDETHAESWKKTMGIDEESLARLKGARARSSSSSNEMTDSAKKKKKKKKKKKGGDEEKKEEEKNGKGGGEGKEEEEDDDNEEEDDGSEEG